jgi:antitoxin VapB
MRRLSAWRESWPRGPITEAITTALRQQLAREEDKRTAPRIRDELPSIGRRCAALPDLDTRSAEEILDCEIGLPR